MVVISIYGEVNISITWPHITIELRIKIALHYTRLLYIILQLQVTSIIKIKMITKTKTILMVYCSFIETSDRLSEIHRSRNVSYLKSRVSHWARLWRD